MIFVKMKTLQIISLRNTGIPKDSRSQDNLFTSSKEKFYQISGTSFKNNFKNKNLIFITISVKKVSILSLF